MRYPEGLGPCYFKITSPNQVGSTSGGGTPGGSAGGDLGGSFPGPTVTGIQGTPVCVTAPSLNDVLTFDGSQWCPAPGGSSFLWFNVTDYGAVGDGTTDDTAAINLAIAALNTATRGVLYFPSGTYKITSALSIATANVLVLGDGDEFGSSVIHQATANTTALNMSAAFATADVAASLIRGIVIKGPGSASSNFGINVTADVLLEHVGVYGFYIGLNLSTTCFYSRVSDCFFTNNAAIGIYGNGVNDITIERCRINGYHATSVPPFGDQNSGIVLEGVLNFRIRDCAIEANDLVGVEITGSGSVNTTSITGLISGCYFENTGTTANGRYVYLHGSSSHAVSAVLIEGCYFNGNTVSGFNMVEGTYAFYTSLTNNSFGFTGGGTNTAVAVTADSNSASWAMWNNQVVSGTVSLPPTSVRFDADVGWPVSDPTTTRGDLIVRNNAGALVRLGLGAANTVLHGSSTDPSYSAVVPADMDVSADITTANATTGHHGFLPKLDGGTTTFLRGDGTYAVPPGTSSASHYLIIASSHSTPLIFGDLVQTSAGDDLIYSS